MSAPEIPTRVGLIGYPLGHSLSAVMHNAAFQELGLNWEYLLVPVPTDDRDNLRVAIAEMCAQEWAGVNITIPYKESILEHLDEFGPHTKAVGAVNTIVNDNLGGWLIGYNTDVAGFRTALEQAGYKAWHGKVVILGAGGAARAVIAALGHHVSQITLANRTVARARKLVRTVLLPGTGLQVVSLNATELLQTALNQADLLVNCTSVGMAPDSDTDPLPPEIILPPSLTVCDVVYNPLETHLLKRAKAVGCRTIDGLGMLVHQGAAAFTLWTGKPAPIDVMERAARAALVSAGQ